MFIVGWTDGDAASLPAVGSITANDKSEVEVPVVNHVNQRPPFKLQSWCSCNCLTCISSYCRWLTEALLLKTQPISALCCIITHLRTNYTYYSRVPIMSVPSVYFGCSNHVGTSERPRTFTNRFVPSFVYTATVKSFSNVASTNFFFFLCRLKSNHPTMLPYFHSQSHPTRPVSYICDTELGIHCAFQCSRMQQVCLSVCLSVFCVYTSDCS